MDSLTKNNQTEATLKQMLKKAFGEKSVQSIIELKEGFFNVAYSAVLEDLGEVIIKIAPKNEALVMSYEKNMMLTEVETLGLTKANTNVPVPAVLYFDQSHTICDADYFIMTKIEGDSYHAVRDHLQENDRIRIDTRIGAYNYLINQIQGNQFGYYGLKESQGTCWREVFRKMLFGVLEDGSVMKTEIGMDYNMIAEQFERQQSIFDVVTTPSLVHWDLWNGNVFIKENQISGIIDFERAMWADPLMEYGFRRHSLSEEFLNGYGKTQFDQEEKRRCCWYDIYLYLIMTIECDYRKYSDDWQYKWARKMLSETMDECVNM